MKDKYLQLRESPLAETLLSIEICLTLMSWLLIIRGSDEFVVISSVAQYLPLILVLIHVLIRRKILNLLPCFVASVTASILFYFALIIIPETGYGCCLTNKFYLAAIVFAFTVFTIQYRLKPKLQAGDTNSLLFPVLSLPPFGIYYTLTWREDLIRLFIFNTVLSAVIYLVMRQLAVFDSKYFYSISKSSIPVKQLKKRNYMTAAYLGELFLISFIILTFVPLFIFTDYVNQVLLKIMPAVLTAFFAFLNFLGSFFLGDDTVVAEGADNYLRERSEDSPWITVLAYILAVLIIMMIIHTLPKAIRMIIQNAPKYRKVTSEVEGVIVDTIEDINPDQKVGTARGHYFGEGYERKIRKKFYTKTRNAMNKGLPVSPSSTPGQIETVLLANGDSEISELRPEYEKVRYSK